MNLRRLFAIHLFVFAAFLVVPFSVPQPPPGEKKEPGKKFDKKGFGPGGPGQRRKLVAEFDKDGDGRLNTEERAAARERIKKDRAGKGAFGLGGKGKGPGGPGRFLTRQLLETLDTDQDGQVTKAEFLDGVKRFFAASDKNKKGTLDEAQIAQAINQLVPGPPTKDGPKDAPKDGPKGPPGGFGPTFANAIVKRADADKDGKVTLPELLQAADTFYGECDKDNKGKLDEVAVAGGIWQLLPAPPGFGGPGGGFGPPGGFAKARDSAKPGLRVNPGDVKWFPEAKLYDTTILRTIFIDFENTKDWEAELADFYHTDVEVPATVTVDGKKYADVGVHFRGNSSYQLVPAGYKHSLNLSFDFVDTKQRLYGYRTLNLLNGADDPTLMHTLLFAHLARQYIPSAKANFVKVVINGESWGIYPNLQQLNKDFLQENYQTTKGARWRVPAQPGGSGAGLTYLGDNVEDYKRHFMIKSTDNLKDWKALVDLCRTVDKTPLDQLEAALKPMLDVDEVLWFLAIDNATINDDGYWTRGSDYYLYRDPKGIFHILPYDINETFTTMNGGPKGKGPKDGGGKGPNQGGFEKGPKDGGFGKPKDRPGGGYALEPLAGLNDARYPLRSRLLQVPTLRARYLKNMQTIAQSSLDWKKIKPLVDQYRSLIDREVELDTRKLYTLDEYQKAVSEANLPAPGPATRFNLKAFFEGRQSYLINHAEVKKAGA